MGESEIRKKRAVRNRTVTLSENDIKLYSGRLIKLKESAAVAEITNKTICQNIFEVVDFLPERFADLAFIDPPYNLSKKFNRTEFKKMGCEDYAQWLDSWLCKITRLLKPTASVYICGDWRSSAAIFTVAAKYFNIRNRITFEREKGRGAAKNWKNCSEDIWFCTMSEEYFFDVNAVKLKRKVLAPYKDESGKPKDWNEDYNGKYRDTCPSNVWTDITIPFWSMSENTDHPTQKSEKLAAKIILASSKPNDIVFDPFLGSGTTSVVAKKLGRRYVGVEIDQAYCCLAEKRLASAEKGGAIQGYRDGVFWERNALSNL